MALTTLENLECKLPAGPLPEDFDIECVFRRFRDLLPSLSSAEFVNDGLWRDLFALTGTIHTFYGSNNIGDTWKRYTANAKPDSVKYLEKSARPIRIGDSNWIDGTFSFGIRETPSRVCKAILSLVPCHDGGWKIWVLRTFIDRLEGHPSVDSLAPSRLVNGAQESYRRKRQSEHAFECVVVGGGQAGLSVAGRLQSQGIEYALLEKNDAVGDNWKNRYKSTKLHTTRESSHLPFERTFPSQYPLYLPKDDLAKGYSDWVEKYEINIWLSTTVVAGQWHEKENHWTLELLQGTTPKQITATHLVMALGAGCQIPTMPTYPGVEDFQGQIQHSAEYTSAEGWQGKHGIVVGTANTAHDVAEDMVAAGMVSVTMIQRSPTYVLPAEYYTRVQNLTYNENIPTELADQMGMTTPVAQSRLISMSVLNEMAKAEPERFDALEKAGFKVIRYGDIIYQIFDRFGGHYMDVGASAKIAKGLIKVKSDALPLRYDNDGLVFTDGSKIKADHVVFATGFVGSMKVAIRELLGSEVADRIEDFWGVNEEGEIKGAFKSLGHPNLWMHGGTCAQARYMSRFIALQVINKFRTAILTSSGRSTSQGQSQEQVFDPSE